MRLIEPLIAGVAGCENGRAVVRRRGTSALAVCYSDHSGTVVAQPTEGFALDANGGATVYVNEIVDVSATSSNGTELRRFTAGDAAPGVEVRSQSFVGTHYDSGVSAAGLPSTLQKVLDAWLTSAGSTDFNVLFDGVSNVRLQDALGSFAGIFRNVKSPTYGAKGDATTDDTAAINSAIQAGAGIVFFPPGDYKVSSAITVPVSVSLWGTGKGSIIRPIANQVVFTFATAGSNHDVRGLQIVSAFATAAGTAILTVADATVTLSSCYLSQTDSGKLAAVTGAGSFTMLESTGTIANGTDGITGTASATIFLERSILSATAASSTCKLVSAFRVYSLESAFSLAAMSSGTSTCIEVTGDATLGAHGWFGGNVFIPGTGGTMKGIVLTSINQATTDVVEAGNEYRAGFTNVWSGFTTGTNLPKVRNFSRDAIVFETTSNVTPLALSPETYGTLILTRTTDTDQALTVSLMPPGSELTIIVKASGITLTAGRITFSTGFVPSTPSIPAANLTTTKISVQKFRVVATAAGGYLTPVAPPIEGMIP